MRKLIFVIFGVLWVYMAYGYGDLNDLLEGDFCQNLCKDVQAKDLSGVRIQGANLQNGQFTCVNFAGADVSNINFNNATLICTNFSDANLANSSFDNANLLGVNFSRANLENAHAKSKLPSNKPYAGTEVYHFFTQNDYGFQGLYFHGSDLSKGDIMNNVTIIKISN